MASSLEQLPGFSFTQTLYSGSWPPQEERLLFDRKDHGALIATVDGRLIYQTVAKEGNLHWTVGSQRTVIISTFNLSTLRHIAKKEAGCEVEIYLILYVSVKSGADKVRFWINDVELEDWEIGEVKGIPIKEYAVIEKYNYQAINVKEFNLSENHRLFLHTIQDLESKLNKPTEYSLIKASGLLRLLIAEDKPGVPRPGSSLGLQIANEVNVNLDFKTSQSIDQQSKIGNAAGDFMGLDSLLFFRRYPREIENVIEIDDFLNWPVATTEQGISTVYHMIKTLAEVSGGIHSGEPKTLKLEKNRVADLSKVYASPNANNESNLISIQFIEKISLIVLQAFKPVVSAVLSQK